MRCRLMYVMPTPCAEPVEGAEVVVNLVGIRANAGPQTFERVHVVGARAVARAAREAGAKRLVHISAIAPTIHEWESTREPKRRARRWCLINFLARSFCDPRLSSALKTSSSTALLPWRACRLSCR